MELAPVNIAVGTFGFFLIFVLSQSNPSTLSSPLLPPPYHGAPSAVILPLYPSPKNSSRTSSISPRHLLRSDSHSSHPNARMRLDDDLVLNGYYTALLWIGTPPQQFALIVDTGSTVTYVPCATCELCGRHQDPKFQPDLSSTYQPVKCTLDCNCDADREQCIYERQYAEMSSSSGVLGEDFMSFGNQSELVPQRAVFGCENEETGDLYSQHADGIMGLGRGDLSVVDQLVEKGVISDSFSLCYGGMDIGGGAMVLGGISAPSDMVFSYSDPVRSPYYNIDLKEIHVAGKQLQLNPSVFDGKYGTVLDSGTTYAYLPEVAFLAFKEAIFKELNSLKQVRGPDPNYNDICFSTASSDVSELSKTFPTVEMVFGHQQKLSLSPENYLFQHSKIHGAYCLGIFQNEKDPTTLLGGIIVRNTLVTYDREHSKIGFWKTNCSELWERLHMPGAPSPSPSSRGKGNSIESPTTLAPGGSPHYDLPEETQIGKIKLDVSFSTNYSYLKLQINKLTEVIAKELDVNASQVNLLNFTSEGTGSLVRLTITPPGSSTYISHESATNIISRLAEHRLRLPDTFGNYQLVQWKVEPSVKRTWWQRNYMAVVVAVIIIIVVGLSVYGVWGMWGRREQTLNTYKPVGAVVPEQELQPL
ncbi:aspartic proteinase 39-like [Hibiscus syriacus]|uniref:aspartic proteinase 39-like n=1 Tax=Hibiscus syriacus TaxID=106335 RepID=UPI001923AB82|nr:aspartic proteinase 39-like [Hibiscus syriacus]